MNKQNYTINFTARCEQIRNAQKVCHNITSNFPHISSTKLAPLVDKLEDKYPKIFDKFLYANPNAGNYIKAQSKSEQKIINIFSWMERLISNIERERDFRHATSNNSFYKIRAIMSQLQNSKIGNCFEAANLSELLMRLNGEKNVYTANIKVGKFQVDHTVCFFNKDGKPFDGKINKKTIILDSWLNDVDFANNMLNKYRNIYKKYMFMPEKGKMSFSNVENLELSRKELNQLIKDFPQLKKKS
jgi:hypothetical protein